MKKSILYILHIVCLFVPFLMPATVWGAQDKSFTVVIDAGHGGHDPGAVGRRGHEKSINLSVALKLGKLIEDNCGDTRVVYTRKKDTFVPLHRRAEIANAAKADLFISIHTNSLASRNSRVSGTETYTLGLHKTEENLEVAKKENSVILIEDDYRQRYAGFNPNSSESYIIFEFLQDKYMARSIDFARQVQKQFKTSARRIDKGVHQAGFLVLRETTMPSVLIELGYITHAAEEQYLLSDKGSSALAKSIYQAFLIYKRGQNGVLAQAGSESASVLQDPEEKEDERSAAVVEEASTVQADGKPVFKIQILTSDRVLPAKSRLFKGLAPVGRYKENGIYKYTYGETTDYNRLLRLKRSKVDAKFKDAFIIAFKNGEKMNINQAIREFKRNR